MIFITIMRVQNVPIILQKKEDIKKQYQVRPYYEGSEELEILWICEECGAYKFTEFESENKGSGNG